MTTVPPIQEEIGPPDISLLGAASAARGLTTGALGNTCAASFRRGLWLLLAIDVATALVLSATVLPLGPRRAATPGAADLLVAVLWVTLLASSRAYDSRPVPFGLEGARNVAHAGLAMAAAGLVLTTVPGQELTSGSILMLSATAAAAAVGERWLADRPLLTRRGGRDVRVVVAGNRRDVDRVLAELRTASTHRYQPVAVCLLGATQSTRYELPVLRGLDNLATAVSRHRAAAVIVAPCRHLDPPRMRRLGWELESSGTQLFVAAGLLDVSRSRTSIGYAGSLPMLHVRQAELRGARRLLKHAAERSLACVALLLLAPCLVVIACVIRSGSEGPALYRQTRVGKDGVLFAIVKFRTMAADADARRSGLVAATAEESVLFKLRDDPRVTREGRILRRYSLDELPQLFNVVRGEMSLVGPRPPLPDEVAQYEPDAHRRLAVTPGMTGLWQVSGRSELTWEESLRLDLRYVDNWSLGLDLRIVCRTAHAVLGHRGAY